MKKKKALFVFLSLMAIAYGSALTLAIQELIKHI